METSTTVRKMMTGNTITVPAYQRAYSWETSFAKSDKGLHVNTFIDDLEDFSRSSAPSYYFGHFLFRDMGNDSYEIVDGQQRLTTIVIFLSVLFDRLKKIRHLTEKEEMCYEDMVKRYSTYRFATVDYDNAFFKDYVIDQSRTDHIGAKTTSARRIIAAFDHMKSYLADKDEPYLTKMLDIVADASCSTHSVIRESDAIQMFIFQNNRGKKPSNLEIIKAQFMYHVHLYGADGTAMLLEEIKEKFEKIYTAISYIEALINEDDVLLYTLRVYFNNLYEGNAIDKINKLLSENDSVGFIKAFTRLLALNFEYLSQFFNDDERHEELHRLISLGGLAVVMPFILKAYQFSVGIENIRTLCGCFESIVLRHRLVGTRADITSRLNDVFRGFSRENPSIQPIVDRINWMKITSDSWWGYWNNKQLESQIQGELYHPAAKYILWRYENHLTAQDKAGYSALRYDSIENPELEHISPQTPTVGKSIETGYSEYDEEFIHEYVNCLGNYLLLSKSHNCSVGNRPFAEKRETYCHLAQQREIQEMTKERCVWDKEMIAARKEKLIKFILETF